MIVVRALADPAQGKERIDVALAGARKLLFSEAQRIVSDALCCLVDDALGVGRIARTIVTASSGVKATARTVTRPESRSVVTTTMLCQ